MSAYYDIFNIFVHMTVLRQSGKHAKIYAKFCP